MGPHQTHCSYCERHLRGGGVWCTMCGYIHVCCSGLASSHDHTEDFVCQHCAAIDHSLSGNEPVNSSQIEHGDSSHSGLTQPFQDLSIGAHNSSQILLEGSSRSNLNQPMQELVINENNLSLIHSGLSQPSRELAISGQNLSHVQSGMTQAFQELAISGPNLSNQDLTTNGNRSRIPEANNSQLTSNDPPQIARPVPNLMSKDFWQNQPVNAKAKLISIYEEVVHWKPNFITINNNKAGRRFVEFMTICLKPITEASQNEDKALLAMMILPHLTLAQTKTQVDGSLNKTLNRRLDSWQLFDLDTLVNEARALQKKKPSSRQTEQKDLKLFTSHMTNGKTSSAIKILEDDHKGRVLRLEETIGNKTVKEILEEKHPKAKHLDPSYIVQCEPDSYHPSIFDNIDSSAILKSALVTNGAHGPSGLDSVQWRKILTSFNEISNELCKQIAFFAKRLATERMHFETLHPYNACRLIPLDKNPGVRPIGIGEVLRRLIGRCITRNISSELQRIGGNTQLCLGQKAGIEHAIHCLRTTFENESCEAILLIDATNAFNMLNRSLAIENIKRICPALQNAASNSYSHPSKLFVNGRTMLSEEGCTQGDPLAMCIYGIAILPLIEKINRSDVTQKWYADDGNVAGKLSSLRHLFDDICKHGPPHGYSVNAPKCQLIIKDDALQEALSCFSGTNVEITLGTRVLGSVIGNSETCNLFIDKKVKEHVGMLTKLSEFASVSPHASYSCLTKGIQSKLTFLARTTPNFVSRLTCAEEIISRNLLPNITGRDQANENERSLLALPTRLGGMNVKTPMSYNHDYQWSKTMSEPLNNLPDLVQESQNHIAIVQKNERKFLEDNHLNEVMSSISAEKREHLQFVQEKGASAWLNVLPLERYKYHLQKRDFRDALCLRYGWEPLNLPSTCPCGPKFTLAHALQCPRGGYTIIRHNEIRDLFARTLDEICHDVQVEPKLQPVQGVQFNHRTTCTDEEARLDIKATGLWGNNFERHFFDVKIFNPMARTCPKNPNEAFRHHEQMKKLKYDERVLEVERSHFTPLVFATTGAPSFSSHKTMKRIADLLHHKRKETYANTITWLRTEVNFALLRSSILCIRGCRSLKPCQPRDDAAISAVISESQIRN